MISDTDVKTIINAALKKDFPLSSERLLLLVNSDLSTYELLDIVCDFINSLGTISKGKDAVSFKRKGICCQHGKRKRWSPA